MPTFLHDGLLAIFFRDGFKGSMGGHFFNKGSMSTFFNEGRMDTFSSNQGEEVQKDDKCTALAPL